MQVSSSGPTLGLCKGIVTDLVCYLDHSIYQSDGLCHDFCKAKIYKLAIIQGDSCWCANNLPDKKLQVDPGDCNSSCPGFPTDVCGGPGLYGYMIVEAGAGTQPAPSPSPSDNNQVSAHGCVLYLDSTSFYFSYCCTTPRKDPGRERFLEDNYILTNSEPGIGGRAV